MNLSVYRKFVTLNNDLTLMLRPQTRDDAANLLQLFEDAKPEDILFLKHDVQNVEILRRWCESTDLNRVLPLLAFHGERIAGSASLHIGVDTHRHAGQVRLYIGPDYRGLGLGTSMIRELIGISLKLGLKLIWAEVVMEQSKVVKAFLDMGFTLSAVLPDWFMDKGGKVYDVAILLHSLERSKRPSF
jgi:L-amino acid N-acyltransferase YncA